MTDLFTNAVTAIPVPCGLDARILTACRAEATTAKRSRGQLMPALAACVAMVVAVMAINPFINHYIQETTPDGAASDGATSTPSGDSSLITPPTTAPSGTTSGDNATYQAYFGLFDEMTVTELDAYFGRAVLPTWLPADLQLLDNGEKHGIYRRDENYIVEHPESWQFMLRYNHVRDEEIVRDVNRFFYQGDGGRNLSLEVATPPCPRTYIGDANRFKEALVLNGIAVKLAYYNDIGGDAGYAYSAMFTVDDTEYYLSGWNIPRAEFLKIIESVI